MTIAEKILARVSGRATVAPGDFLEIAASSLRSGITVISPNSMKNVAHGRMVDMLDWGLPLFDPEKIRIVDGHLGASASHRAAEGRAFAREWAAKMGVPKRNFVRLGRAGIENIIAAERCWALPGDCFFHGANGHISTAGAVGAFTSSLAHEAAAYLVWGRTWVKVPRTVRVNVVGRPAKGVYPRDISETLLKQIGPTGSVGSIIEWGGEYIDDLSMEGRLAICSQAIFTGAWTAIVNPDEKTLEYVNSRTDVPFEPLVSDPDAPYWKTITIDAASIEPVVVVPPTRFDIRSVDKVVGTPITKGFIGSDAGGWLSDLRVAAQVLRGKKLHDDVVLNVTPGTVEILKGALREGLLEVFLDAGCVVPTPNEGMECGYNTPLEDGDVCVSTGQTNYPGRMGSVSSEIYLANGAVVAASCIEGKIADPRPYLT